jgi:hypothetical protein
MPHDLAWSTKRAALGAALLLVACHASDASRAGAPVLDTTGGMDTLQLAVALERGGLCLKHAPNSWTYWAGDHDDRKAEVSRLTAGLATVYLFGDDGVLVGLGVLVPAEQIALWTNIRDDARTRRSRTLTADHGHAEWNTARGRLAARLVQKAESVCAATGTVKGSAHRTRVHLARNATAAAPFSAHPSPSAGSEPARHYEAWRPASPFPG